MVEKIVIKGQRDCRDTIATENTIYAMERIAASSTTLFDNQIRGEFHD